MPIAAGEMQAFQRRLSGSMRRVEGWKGCTTPGATRCDLANCQQAPGTPPKNEENKKREESTGKHKFWNIDDICH